MLIVYFSSVGELMVRQPSLLRMASKNGKVRPRDDVDDRPMLISEKETDTEKLGESSWAALFELTLTLIPTAQLANGDGNLLRR